MSFHTHTGMANNLETVDCVADNICVTRQILGR